MSDLARTDEGGPPATVTSQDRLLTLIRQRYPDYHPVLAMVDIAQTTEDEVLEFNAHKEVAKYVVQVDRQTEIKREIKQTRRVIVELFNAPSAGHTPLDGQVHKLSNNPSPVLDAQVVEDVVQERTVMNERGSVGSEERQEADLATFSKFLERD